MGQERSSELPSSARPILAAWAVAGDVAAPAVARIAGVHLAEVEAAIASARGLGLLGADGELRAEVAARLVEECTEAQRAELHAAAARHLLTEGPDRVMEAIAHARAAGGAVPLDELVAMAERGGRLCLSLNDARTAADLLQLAVDLDSTRDDIDFGQRLCDLADARQALGDVGAARDLYARAFLMGERVGDPSLAVRAAIGHALPVEWFHGDDRSASQLARAAALQLRTEQRAVVLAARSMVEMRVPLLTGGDQQIAWVTRPTVARAFADEAMGSVGLDDPWSGAFVRAAWRACHRAPRLLERRREVSQAALDLAQTARRPALLVETSNWLAVDALESGDRPLHLEALAVARWVATRDGAPWLRWQAALMAAGSALVDGDLDQAEKLRIEAADIALAMHSPRWLSADHTILVQLVLERDDPAEMEAHLIDDDSALLAHPLASAWMANLRVRLGQVESAELLVGRALERLDEEASYLHVGTRCAAVALQLGSPDLLHACLEVLGPWSSSVAVDSLGWSCDGPVALWVAALQHELGESGEALRLLDEGEALAVLMHDVRAVRRAGELRARIGVLGGEGPASVDLTLRELEVLRLLASGATNPEIAKRLSFSLGTIRSETSAIYRKLGVQGRTTAVARAIELGLVVPVS